MFLTGPWERTLYAKATDPGTEGGTGGTEGEGGDPAPKYVTEEQLNKALSKRDGDFQRKLDKQLETSFGKFTETLGTKFDEFKTSLTPAPPEEPGKKKELTPQDLEGHPLFKGLKKQVADAEKRLQEITDREAQQKRANRDLTLRQKARDLLAKNGIASDALEDVTAILIDGKKALRYESDDSDDVVFEHGGETLDLDTGVKSWAKSDAAKRFLPARGASGSGHRPGQGTSGGKQTPAGTQPSSTQVFRDLAGQLYEGLPPATGTDDDS